jgi:hypothetical protein
MRFRSALLLFPALALLLFAAGCSTGDDTDTQAPTVVIQSPAQGDTVGVVSVAVTAAAVDDFGVTRVELYLDDSLAQTFTAEPYQATIILTAHAEGPHRLQAKAYDAAGNVGQSAVVTFVKGIRTGDVVYRMSLVEIVTSATCSPCVAANEYFGTATNTDFYRQRSAVIKYHAWVPLPTDSLWLLTQAWARPRIIYLFDPIPYTNVSAPNAWVDGGTAGNTGVKWMHALDQAIPVAAEAKIELTKQDISGGASLSIKVTGLTGTAYSDLRLHTVVTETNIAYRNINGETVHYDVMRTMLPDADGEAITMAQHQAQTYQRTVLLGDGWVKDNCSVIVFVQSASSKHVLQAAKISLQ